MTSSPKRLWLVGVAIATMLAACAAPEKPAPRSPEAAEPSPAAELSSPSAPPQAGYPQQQPGQVYPYAPPPATPIQAAANDFDTAERELSVAAGDCSNACRALGSMDRAAGNICKLSSDKPRCDDATAKVRSARDKVKNSCGECKETSTDSKAPVPSR